MLIKILSISVALLALSGCAHVGTPSETASAMITENSLRSVTTKRFDLVYAESPLGHLGSVFFEPLELGNVEIIQPALASTGVSRMRSEWELNDSDITWLQQAFQRSINSSFSANNLTLAESAAEADVVIRAEILRMKPTAPKDDLSRSPGSRYYTKHSGEIDIRYVLTRNDTPIIVIEDRRDAGNDSMTASLNNRVSTRYDIMNLFNSWSLRLGKTLDELALPES